MSRRREILLEKDAYLLISEESLHLSAPINKRNVKGQRGEKKERSAEVCNGWELSPWGRDAQGRYSKRMQEKEAKPGIPKRMRLFGHSLFRMRTGDIKLRFTTRGSLSLKPLFILKIAHQETEG